MEGPAGDVDEWDDENEFERIDDVIADLRGGYVEAEDKGHRETEDRCASEERIDADQKSDGDAPCQSFRRGSHAKKREDRESDAAVDPVVMGRSGAVGVSLAVTVAN